MFEEPDVVFIRPCGVVGFIFPLGLVLWRVLFWLSVVCVVYFMFKLYIDSGMAVMVLGGREAYKTSNNFPYNMDCVADECPGLVAIEQQLDSGRDYLCKK